MHPRQPYDLLVCVKENEKREKRSMNIEMENVDVSWIYCYYIFIEEDEWKWRRVDSRMALLLVVQNEKIHD